MKNLKSIIAYFSVFFFPFAALSFFEKGDLDIKTFIPSFVVSLIFSVGMQKESIGCKSYILVFVIVFSLTLFYFSPFLT